MGLKRWFGVKSEKISEEREERSHHSSTSVLVGESNRNRAERWIDKFRIVNKIVGE